MNDQRKYTYNCPPRSACAVLTCSSYIILYIASIVWFKVGMHTHCHPVWENEFQFGVLSNDLRAALFV